MTNPFFITGIIPERYFCDREKETQHLISIIIMCPKIENGSYGENEVELLDVSH